MYKGIVRKNRTDHGLRLVYSMLAVFPFCIVLSLFSKEELNRNRTSLFGSHRTTEQTSVTIVLLA